MSGNFDKDYSLTDEDLTKLLGNCDIVSYDKIHKMHNINELFQKNNYCVLLYQTEKNYGHWTVLLKRHSPKLGEIIEFFDPYGEGPDEQLNYVSPEEKIKNHEDHPYLLELLNESGYPIVYNDYPFQDDHSDIRTCGRWAALRIACRNLSLPEFEEFAHSNELLDSDDVSTILTGLFL
jgi:hypothetical protein